jgi:hypothetical protein
VAANDSRQAQIQRRRAWLAELGGRADEMLDELAGVIGVTPPQRLRSQPEQTLAEVAEFCRQTDFSRATQDGRTWMLNRLGLYIARFFTARFGGTLVLQDEPTRSFYLHYVLCGMRPPVLPDARLDPFAIAHDLLNAQPKPDLTDLIEVAERALVHGPIVH